VVISFERESSGGTILNHHSDQPRRVRVVCVDKHCAESRRWRVSEGTLLLTALVGGSSCAIVGQRYLRQQPTSSHLKAFFVLYCSSPYHRFGDCFPANGIGPLPDVSLNVGHRQRRVYSIRLKPFGKLFGGATFGFSEFRRGSWAPAARSAQAGHAHVSAGPPVDSEDFVRRVLVSTRIGSSFSSILPNTPVPRATVQTKYPTAPFLPWPSCPPSSVASRIQSLSLTVILFLVPSRVRVFRSWNRPS